MPNPDPPTPLAHALAIRAARAHRDYLRDLAQLQRSQAERDRAFLFALEAPGMSYGKLAKVAGIPRGTVQSIVRRVRG